MLGGGASVLAWTGFFGSRCTDGCHERIIRGNQSDHICIPCPGGLRCQPDSVHVAVERCHAGKQNRD
jgi:hypothetical protein